MSDDPDLPEGWGTTPGFRTFADDMADLQRENEQLRAQVAALTVERDSWEAKANEMSEWANALCEDMERLEVRIAALTARVEARDTIILWYLDQPAEKDGWDEWKAWFDRRQPTYAQTMSEIER
jgi:predicted nuclease with TOPRIM domain